MSTKGEPAGDDLFRKATTLPNNRLRQKLVMGLQEIPAALLHSMKRRYCIENGNSPRM